MRSRKHKAIGQATETLEIRDVKAAAITAALSATGVLNVTGTDNQDLVHVLSNSSGVVVQRYLLLPAGGPGGPLIEVPVGNIPISTGGTLQTVVLRNQVSAIFMDMKKGDDRITLETDIRSFVYGGDGNDILIGGQGVDYLFGDSGNDWLYGNDGDNRLYGGGGDDRLFGGNGSDVIYGDADNDKLFGNDGIDWLYGGSGDDYLSGGNGVDQVDGGTGVDTFRRNVFLPGSGLSLTVEPVADQPAEVSGAFLSEAASPDNMFDIDQAGSPTCAFLATLASVARTTGTTNDLVDTIQYDAASDSYGITLFVWGTRTTQVLGRTITVPAAVSKTVWVNGDWTEGRDPGGKLWVTLYQKAYLQLLGATTRDGNGACLESTQWRAATGKDWIRVNDAYFALTGRTTAFVASATATAQSMYDKYNASNSMGMVVDSVGSGTSSGVIAGHCYSVYKIFRDALGNWLVRLRNPWAHDGIGGALYDRNAEQQQYADDGLITLTWSQFTSNFHGFTA